MEMHLALDDFTVRSFRPSDATSLAKHANNRAIWINLRDRFPHPYTHRDAVEWIDLVTSMSPETNFAIAVEDMVVGGIGILQQSDVHSYSAEFGYWLGQEYWGRGIMSRAVGEMSDYYFKTLDLNRLYATVYDWNPASARILEKCGWELEGRLKKSVFKDGKFCDQLIFAKVKADNI